MKKYISLFLIMVLLLSVISACKFQKNNPQNSVTSSTIPNIETSNSIASSTVSNTGTSSTSDSSQANSGYFGTKDEKLISILKSAIPKGGNIAYFYSGDLEGNKKSEAFAFVGTSAFNNLYNDHSIDADLWFITANGAKKVYKSYQSVTFQPYVWTVGNLQMLKVENSGGGSSSNSLAWIVQNGSPVECGIGMGMSSIGDSRNFVTIGDGFDAYTDITFKADGSSDSITVGHTYKIYYFYWDGSVFKEYGGIKISLKQLLAVSGAKQIIDQIQSKGYQIGDIFYRANNIININYNTLADEDAVKAHTDYSISYDNATLLYQNNSVKLVKMDHNSEADATLEQSDYGGSYIAAINPSIASYPSKFPLE